MSKRDELQNAPRKAVFDVMDDTRVGMLGVEGSGQHMQPMTHFPDRDTGEIWFITSIETDLVRAVGQGARAHYCVVSKDQDFYACLAGTLEQAHNSAKLDDLWSPMVAAWFEGGREDPKVSLLRLVLSDGALWATTESTVKLGIEIARANLSSGHKPDIGDHMEIRFQ